MSMFFKRFYQFYGTNSTNHFKRYLNTIYALSSGNRKCGVAVIRISGPNSMLVLKKMAKIKKFTPRKAVLKKIIHPYEEEILDKGIIIWFPGPNSFTGEDCCELQVHGGSAVVSSILSALSLLPDFRPAEPGEFTKRAFFSGKLDLLEVEGLADLINAETESQRKQAFIQSDGVLSQLYEKWRLEIINCSANLEAFIDFDESENLDQDVLNVCAKKVKKLSKEIAFHLNEGFKGERLKNGVRTVIIGEPNVGKSSIFNLIVKRPAAIVTPIAGTTRDVIETMIDINGYPLVLIDTAGLREDTEDIIEKEGIKRAKVCIHTADFILIVIDAKKLFGFLNKNNRFDDILNNYLSQISINEMFNNTKNGIEKKLSIIVNKIDLLTRNELGILKDQLHSELIDIVFVSCMAKENENLFEHLTKSLKELCGNPSKENPLLTQQRHRYHLEKCSKNLNQFLTEISSNNFDVVLVAEHLRKSTHHLGKITGKITVDDILDVIFKNFCIGK